MSVLMKEDMTATLMKIMKIMILSDYFGEVEDMMPKNYMKFAKLTIWIPQEEKIILAKANG